LSVGFEEALKNRSIAYRKNVLTATLSTFRIGGACPYVVEPCCIGELCDVLALCRQTALSYALIGRASNILFDDTDLPSVLVRTVRLDAVKWEGNGILRADCGVLLPRLAHCTAKAGYGDLCFAAGIPGTVGGGIYMNAGAHGKDLGSLIKYVVCYEPYGDKITTYFNKELSFCYRKSDFQTNNAIILQAAFQLVDLAPPAVLQARIKAFLARRRDTQPLQQPSAGSVFLRPDSGEPMGKILDELGLKGMRCGNAAVSSKHAGFIVNLGGATAADVLTLIGKIQEIVEKERGFRPVPEIRYITEKKK